MLQIHILLILLTGSLAATIQGPRFGPGTTIAGVVNIIGNDGPGLLVGPDGIPRVGSSPKSAFTGATFGPGSVIIGQKNFLGLKSP